MEDFYRIKAEIDERDRRDKTRAVSPLVRVPEAIYINSDDITAEEVAQIIVNRVRRIRNEKNC